MPPEPFPLDRKHERSEFSSLESTLRVRDSPPSYYGSSRYESRRPSGYGKQGGWNQFSEEFGCSYVSFRSSDRKTDDETGRLSISRVESKYSRNSRESRSAFSQRDCNNYSCDMSNGRTGTPGRLHAMNIEQKLADNMVTNSTSDPTSCESASAMGKDHAKEHHDDNNVKSHGWCSQPGDRENSLDWKPFKWSRSGSLSSRGSGFSHSSSSKSLGGADSNSGKVELQAKTATPTDTISRDAIVISTSAAPAEDFSSRKKRRLGWGEGLAKYEKKKVEVFDASVNKDGADVSVHKDGADASVDKDGGASTAGNNEPIPSQSPHLADKSPGLVAHSDCFSPATRSSVSCSSSPGMEDKILCNSLNVDNAASNLCSSSSISPQSHLEASFNLEELDVSSLAMLSSSLIDLLQSDDSGCTDSGFMSSTAINKLLVWKGDVLKALEATESEIDSLDNELLALKSESISELGCLAASGSLPSEDCGKPCSRRETASSGILRPSPLQVAFEDDDVEKVRLCTGSLDDSCVKDSNVNSPETATSNFFEPSSLADAVSPSTDALDTSQPIAIELEPLASHNRDEDTNVISSEDTDLLNESKDCMLFSEDTRSHENAENNLCNSILTCNREIATRASDVFNKLLSTDQCKNDFSQASNVSLSQNNALVAQRIATRKRDLRSKEGILTLKFKALQHLWKEDMRVQSIRKHRSKSLKKFELSSRTTQNGYHKHRSPLPSQFSSPGNSSPVPVAEVPTYVSKLISEPDLKIYRDNLKMPAMILDEKEKLGAKFFSSNGLVEDPCAVEKERALHNPWTPYETELFIDKLATIGKDFRKIASFLDHKTTADCIEFYYKNHKSDSFKKTKQNKRGKKSNNYMVGSGKTWKANAALLDILGAASVVASDADNAMMSRQMQSDGVISGGGGDSKVSNGGVGSLEKEGDFDFPRNESETEAADALVGFCGSISSEAMGSCITTTFPVGRPTSIDVKKCRKVKNVLRPTESDVSENIDEDICSDESVGEMDVADWDDMEKLLFLQALSSYGKDFSMIARCIKTRSRDQCKAYFSKARKCLGLDSIHSGSTNIDDDAVGGGSDIEGACMIEAGSVIGTNELRTKMENELPSDVKNVKQVESDAVERIKVQTDLSRFEEKGEVVDGEYPRIIEVHGEVSDAHQPLDAGSCSNLSVNVETVHREVSFELNSTEKFPSAVPQDSCLASAISGLADCTERRQCEITQHFDKAGYIKSLEQVQKSLCSNNYFLQNLASHCFGNQNNSSQVIGGISLPDTTKNRKNGDVRRSISEVQDLINSEREANDRLVAAEECHLQSSNSSKAVCSLPGFPVTVRDKQASDYSRGHSRSLSDTEKPCSNGDVKLFGTVLSYSSTSQKSNSWSPLDNHEKGTQSGSSSKLSTHIDASQENAVDRNGRLLKLECDLGLTNVPIRSCSFWDGIGIQGGLSSTSDSPILSANHPAAFSKYQRHPTKTEQLQGLHPVVKTNAMHLNGNCDSNGVAYQMYKSQEAKVRALTLEMKQHQKILELPRRNGLEPIASLQQQQQQQQGQGASSVGGDMTMMGRGGVIVGEPCNSVLDPVSAIKMHYSKTDQFCYPNGNS